MNDDDAIKIYVQQLIKQVVTIEHDPTALERAQRGIEIVKGVTVAGEADFSRMLDGLNAAPSGAHIPLANDLLNAIGSDFKNKITVDNEGMRSLPSDVNQKITQQFDKLYSTIMYNVIDEQGHLNPEIAGTMKRLMGGDESYNKIITKHSEERFKTQLVSSIVVAASQDLQEGFLELTKNDQDRMTNYSVVQSVINKSLISSDNEPSAVVKIVERNLNQMNKDVTDLTKKLTSYVEKLKTAQKYNFFESAETKAKRQGKIDSVLQALQELNSCQGTMTNSLNKLEVIKNTAQQATLSSQKAKELPAVDLAAATFSRSGVSMVSRVIDKLQANSALKTVHDFIPSALKDLKIEADEPKSTFNQFKARFTAVVDKVKSDSAEKTKSDQSSNEQDEKRSDGLSMR